jgi:hypothetical protein
MRNVGDGWHDQRLIELVALLALAILVISGVRVLYETPKPSTQASFIVPSQTVRW